MNLPQIILSVLLILSLGMSIAKNGEPKGNYSSGYSFLAIALEFALLYWGGFFK